MCDSFLGHRPDQCVPLSDQCVPLSASIIILNHIMLTPSQLGNLLWKILYLYLLILIQILYLILYLLWKILRIDCKHFGVILKPLHPLLLTSASIPCPPNIGACLFSHNAPHTFMWPGLITLLYFKVKKQCGSVSQMLISKWPPSVILESPLLFWDSCWHLNLLFLPKETVNMVFSFFSSLITDRFTKGTDFLFKMDQFTMAMRYCLHRNTGCVKFLTLRRTLIPAPQGRNGVLLISLSIPSAWHTGNGKCLFELQLS